MSVGTDPRDVDELLDSQLARFHSDALGAFDMHCMERLVAMFDIQTDRIYHTAHAADRVGH